MHLPGLLVSVAHCIIDTPSKTPLADHIRHQTQTPDFLRAYPALASAAVHPAVMAAGIVANMAALTIYHHLHRGERCQDALLVAVVGTGAALGFLVAGMDAAAWVLRVTPWCGIVALLWSTYGPGMKDAGRRGV